MISVANIERALRGGSTLHAFRSGGGLRVVRVEDGGLEGYGEHPHVEVALQHADEDIACGGRPYKEVYGGKYEHFLTGSSLKSSEFDNHLLRGGTVDACFDGGMFRVKLNGHSDNFDRVSRTGEAVTLMDAIALALLSPEKEAA